MSENFVAIGHQSLYPDIRGSKVMPDELPRTRGIDDDAHEVNGETKQKQPKAEERRRTQQEESERRARELQKELREARESTKKTKKAAGVDKKPDTSQEGSPDVTKVEQVLQHLREGGQIQEFPIDKVAADAALAEAREAYAGRGHPDTVFETEVGSQQVGIYREEGKLYLTGLPDAKYKGAVLAEILAQSGIDKHADFPKDFDKWSIKQRREYVAEKFEINFRDSKMVGVVPPPGPAWYDALPTGGPFTAEMTRFTDRIRQIGVAHRDDLDRLIAIRDKFDEAVVTNALGGSTQAEIDQVTEVLENRLAELRVAEREALERARETPPADDLLLITQHTKELIRQLMEGDLATTPNWAAMQAEVQDLLVKAEQIVEGVVPAAAGPAMASGEVIETAIPGRTDPYKTGTYRYVFEVTRAFDEANKRYISADDRAKLELIAGGADRLNKYAAKRRSERLIYKLDQHFTKIFADLTADQQDLAVGDINEKANHYYHAAISGWRDLDEATRIVLGLIDRREDPDGLRDWKATNGFERIMFAVKIYQRTATPHDWQQVPEILSNIFNDVEDTQVSPDDLGSVAQRARQIIESIPPTEEGKQLRIKLSDRVEAFKAWHVMIMNLDKKDMDPESVIQGFQEYFEGREESTLEDFLERFGEDNRGRAFYIMVDENGNALATPERVDLFDVEYRLINETLQGDRIRMNIIEEMTRHAIADPFDAGTLVEIQKWAGLRNADGTINPFFGWNEQFFDYAHGVLDQAGLVAFFNDNVEQLRVYYRDKMQQKINGTPVLAGMAVDDIWGRKRNLTINGLDTTGIKITKDLITDWKTKRTLHGAFGTVGEGDLAELADEFGMPYTADIVTHEPIKNTDEWKAVREKFLGKSFLEIRRNVLKEKMIVQLQNQGLQVNRNIGDDEDLDLRDADLEELNESGFFGSVEYNVYQWAWIKLWGNLDNVRIYSRDSKSKAPLGMGRTMQIDDDFEDIVFHKSTNLFWDRGISHAWEFYHEGIETRGRPKEGDVNRIFKQFLPGKHHYVFPQNTAAARWAQQFMSIEQKAEVERRAKYLMTVYDFDNTVWHQEYIDWMKMVVVMDMIENGQFSFTQRDPRTGRYKKFSDVVKEKGIGKFEMIDLFGDRKKHKDWLGPTMFQAFLANPTLTRWTELTDKTKNYYSTRDARLFPFEHLGLRALWELANRHSQRLFDRVNLQSAEMENYVDGLDVAGYVDKETAVDFKRKNLGFVRFAPHGDQDKLAAEEVPKTAAFLVGSGWARRIRQFGEIFRLSGWENKWSLGGILGVFFAMVGDFFKRLPGQVKEQ